MTSAVEIFQQLEPVVKGTPYEDVWGVQWNLVRELAAGTKPVDAVPAEQLGAHALTSERPVSTTSSLAVTPDLVFKFAAILNKKQDGFQQNNHYLFPLDEQLAAVMCLVGEAAACNSLNQKLGVKIHHGVAGATISKPGEVNLSHFDLEKVLGGDQEVALVMKRMSGNLFDRAQSVAEGQPGTSEADLIAISRTIIQCMVEGGALVGDEQAYATSRPERVLVTLTGDTPGWFANRTEAPLQPFVQVGKQVIEQFKAFFALPDTNHQLRRRAVGTLGTGADSSPGTRYFGGDLKYDNILTQGDEVAASDLTWLVLRPNRPNNEIDKPGFASWAFHDVMEAAAYHAIQPQALGLESTVAAIKDELKTALKKEWSSWHDLYFTMLVGYKLMVQAAVMADGYLSYFDKTTGEPLEPVPAKIKEQVEEYPEVARKITAKALTTYINNQAAA
jgi:hypothetical protein